MTFLFIDTNVLLHYRRLDEIDWAALANADNVTVILCLTVIRELDRQKFGHPQRKFRKRAQEITAYLHSKSDTAGALGIRENVRLEFCSEDPSPDFNTLGLRTDLPDDWIIATILEWKKAHPKDEVRLVSVDLGLTIKARAKGVPVLVPADADRLADELDGDEKLIKRLQQELAETKSAWPDLKLCLEKEDLIAKLKIFPQLEFDANQAAAEMEMIRSKYPFRPTTGEPRKRSFIETITLADLAQEDPDLRYNRGVQSFYDENEKYLRELHEYKNIERRTIRFEIFLKNDGKSPADDVEIRMHFPDGFQLLDAEINAPTAPEPPMAPGTYGRDNFLGNLGHLASQISSPFPSNVSSPTIERTNSYDVRSTVARIKHGYKVPVATFLAVFDNYGSAKSFQIDYAIFAANVPTPAGGHLSIVIEKDTAMLQ